MRRFSFLSLAREALRGHAGWQAQWRSPERPAGDYDAVIVGGGGHGLATAKDLGETLSANSASSAPSATSSPSATSNRSSRVTDMPPGWDSRRMREAGSTRPRAPMPMGSGTATGAGGGAWSAPPVLSEA